jgi:hypothetical protein
MPLDPTNHYESQNGSKKLQSSYTNSISLAIPPGQFAKSEPNLRKDIIYPNAQFHTLITGPSHICDDLHSAGLVRYTRGGIHKNDWSEFDIWREDAFRSDQYLGKLFDIRQALLFSRNEFDFRTSSVPPGPPLTHLA